MNPTPTHANIIATAIANRLESVRVALPGRIEAYDAATQQAEVQPLIQDGDSDPDDGDARVARRIPKLLSVPVLFPGSGAYRITWPINPGDQCLLVFSSSSLEYWLSVGGEVDPGDDRHHDISDAIAIPGLHDFAHVPTPAPTNSMTMHASSILLGGPNAAQSMIRGDSFMSSLSTLLVALNTFAATCTTVPAGSPATTLANAVTAFVNAAATFKSSAMKLS